MALTLPTAFILGAIALWCWHSDRDGGGAVAIYILFGIALGGTTWAAAGNAINDALAQGVLSFIQSIAGMLTKKA